MACARLGDMAIFGDLATSRKNALTYKEAVTSQSFHRTGDKVCGNHLRAHLARKWLSSIHVHRIFVNYYGVMFISFPPRSCKINSQSVVYATDSNEIEIMFNYYAS